MIMIRIRFKKKIIKIDDKKFIRNERTFPSDVCSYAKRKGVC